MPTDSQAVIVIGEHMIVGIEQHEQFCQLQDEHCDSGQGFMFARPLAADDVNEFLATLPRPQLPPAVSQNTLH